MSGRVEHADGNRPATSEERGRGRAPQSDDRASLTGKNPAGMLQPYKCFQRFRVRHVVPFEKKSQPSTTLPYFDTTTRRRAQNQALSDRQNAEGDAGTERQRLRQAAAGADRRYTVTPAWRSCCVKSYLQPTYMHTHTHTKQLHQLSFPLPFPPSLAV